MKAREFWESQLRRGSWVWTKATIVGCLAAGYHLGEYNEYLGPSHYLIQVCYIANDREVLAEFRWNKPLLEGDTLSLRYDPANPECHSRSGIWIARQAFYLSLLGLIALIAGRLA